MLAWLHAQGGVQLAPRLLGFTDGGPVAPNRVTLVLEDLGAAHWPPPYPADTEPLFAALEVLGGVPVPPDLRRVEEMLADARPYWEIVATDPAPFLGLAVCSEPWFRRNVEALLDAERRVTLGGEQLVHNDIYSANVCFKAGHALLVDWVDAARGNGEIDVAYAVLSVLVEGGRLPDRPLLADEGAWAARLAGHNAIEASAPLPEWAIPSSTMRAEQLGDLRVALPWAVRTLDLEPLD